MTIQLITKLAVTGSALQKIQFNTKCMILKGSDGYSEEMHTCIAGAKSLLDTVGAIREQATVLEQQLIDKGVKEIKASVASLSDLSAIIIKIQECEKRGIKLFRLSDDASTECDELRGRVVELLQDDKTPTDAFPRLLSLTACIDQSKKRPVEECLTDLMDLLEQTPCDQQQCSHLLSLLPNEIQWQIYGEIYQRSNDPDKERDCDFGRHHVLDNCDTLRDVLDAIATPVQTPSDTPDDTSCDSKSHSVGIKTLPRFDTPKKFNKKDFLTGFQELLSTNLISVPDSLIEMRREVIHHALSKHISIAREVYEAVWIDAGTPPGINYGRDHVADDITQLTQTVARLIRAADK